MKIPLQRPETRFLAMSLRTHVFARADLFENVRANLDWFLRRDDIKQFAFSPSAHALATLGLETGDSGARAS